METKTQGLKQEDGAYYDEFRGPADYISGLTDAKGRYILRLPPGHYCLVARKRAGGEPDVGPLTPEDFSSIVSQPIEITEENDSFDINFPIRVGHVKLTGNFPKGMSHVWLTNKDQLYSNIILPKKTEKYKKNYIIGYGD